MRRDPAALRQRALRLSVQYAIEEADDALPTRDRIRRWAAAALAAVVQPTIDEAVLVVRFVDRDEGRRINREFRSKDYATNVLTFPYDDAATIAATRRVEADLVICVPVVADEARAQHKPFGAHCAHLIVHGTLHACGHDHEDPAEADTMEAIERRVLSRFRIDDPYRDDASVAA